VNVFRGHVLGGRARVGELEFSAPAVLERAPAHVFVRPHELEISPTPVPGSFAARVERIAVLGTSVRVELRAPGYGERLEAWLDLPRSRTLLLRAGDGVYLSPRRVRVFPAGEVEPDSLTASHL